MSQVVISRIFNTAEDKEGLRAGQIKGSTLHKRPTLSKTQCLAEIVQEKSQTRTQHSDTVFGSNRDSNDDDINFKEKIINKATGKCPETVIKIQGEPVQCLMDSGSEV